MILLFGLTGRIGQWLPGLLNERAERVRAVVRDPVSARQRLGDLCAGVELVLGDATDAAALGPVFEGVDRVYIGLSTGRTSDELQLFDAVAAAGVRRVVKISGFGAAADCVIPMGVAHFEIECHLKRLGLAATALRPSLMMNNLLGEASAAIAAGKLLSNAEDYRISWVHPRDVAAVAAIALTESNHEGKAYDLTGPEALTYDELAKRLSRVVGRTVEHKRVSDAAYAAELEARGFEAWGIQHLVTMYRDAVRTGYFDRVTNDVATVSGRAATPIDVWIDENRAALSPP